MYTLYRGIVCGQVVWDLQTVKRGRWLGHESGIHLQKALLHTPGGFVKGSLESGGFLALWLKEYFYLEHFLRDSQVFIFFKGSSFDLLSWV